MALALLGLAALLSAASASERKKYCVRRAALVPAPAPNMRSAEPARGSTEIAVSNDTVVYAKPPQPLQGSNVGLWVPREQLALRFLISAHRMFSIGITGELGLAEGAIPVAPGLLKPPSDPIGGGGLHMNLHVPVSRRVTIDVSCDLWGYSVKSRVAWYQADSCSGLPPPNSWQQSTRNTAIFMGRLQVAVGVALGWSHLTFGVGVRNQPHNTDQTEEWQLSPADIDPQISQEAYPYLYALWDIRATDWLTVGLGMYQPLMFDPVAFAPIFGIQIRFITPKPSPAPRPKTHAEPQPIHFVPGRDPSPAYPF